MLRLDRNYFPGHSNVQLITWSLLHLPLHALSLCVCVVITVVGICNPAFHFPLWLFCTLITCLIHSFRRRFGGWFLSEFGCYRWQLNRLIQSLPVGCEQTRSFWINRLLSKCWPAFNELVSKKFLSSQSILRGYLKLCNLHLGHQEPLIERFNVIRGPTSEHHERWIVDMTVYWNCSSSAEHPLCDLYLRGRITRLKLGSLHQVVVRLNVRLVIVLNSDSQTSITEISHPFQLIQEISLNLIKEPQFFNLKATGLLWVAQKTSLLQKILKDVLCLHLLFPKMQTFELQDLLELNKMQPDIQKSKQQTDVSSSIQSSVQQPLSTDQPIKQQQFHIEPEIQRKAMAKQKSSHSSSTVCAVVCIELLELDHITLGKFSKWRNIGESLPVNYQLLPPPPSKSTTSLPNEFFFCQLSLRNARFRTKHVQLKNCINSSIDFRCCIPLLTSNRSLRHSIRMLETRLQTLEKHERDLIFRPDYSRFRPLLSENELLQLNKIRQHFHDHTLQVHVLVSIAQRVRLISKLELQCAQFLGDHQRNGQALWYSLPELDGARVLLRTSVFTCTPQLAAIGPAIRLSRLAFPLGIVCLKLYGGYRIHPVNLFSKNKKKVSTACSTVVHDSKVTAVYPAAATFSIPYGLQILAQLGNFHRSTPISDHSTSPQWNCELYFPVYSLSWQTLHLSLFAQSFNQKQDSVILDRQSLSLDFLYQGSQRRRIRLPNAGGWVQLSLSLTALVCPPLLFRNHFRHPNQAEEQLVQQREHLSIGGNLTPLLPPTSAPSSNKVIVAGQKSFSRKRSLSSFVGTLGNGIQAKLVFTWPKARTLQVQLLQLSQLSSLRTRLDRVYFLMHLRLRDRVLRVARTDPLALYGTKIDCQKRLTFNHLRFDPTEYHLRLSLHESGGSKSEEISKLAELYTRLPQLALGSGPVVLPFLIPFTTLGERRLLLKKLRSTTHSPSTRRPQQSSKNLEKQLEQNESLDTISIENALHVPPLERESSLTIKRKPAIFHDSTSLEPQAVPITKSPSQQFALHGDLEAVGSDDSDEESDDDVKVEEKDDIEDNKNVS